MACLALASAAPLQAQTWNVVSGDFRLDANWDPMFVPEAGTTAFINNAGTANIGGGASLVVGNLLLGGDGTGSVNQSGSLTMNGSVLKLSSTLNANSVVGNVAQTFASVGTSALIMNGGEIQVDDPHGEISGKVGLSVRFNYTGADGNTWDTSGLFNKDLVIGNRSRGRLELHGNSKMYLADDLGLANNGNGNGQEAVLVMDGSSLLAIGSGAEIGKVASNVAITLSASAKFASGNSLGPGNALGQTDEGYITLGTRSPSVQNVVIQNQAEMQCMTFQNRLGTNSISLKNEGKLKIYNVFSGAGTILATRPSYIASGSACSTIITLRDSSSLSVDCQLGNVASGGSNGVNGLHVSGGENLQSAVSSNPGSYNGSEGGVAVIDVGDQAVLDIKQGLHLCFGTDAPANSTLRFVGPDAAINIGGNLNLAFNEYVDALVPGAGSRPGTATLEYVITGNSHKAVTVAGAARISNGLLRLVLANYVPPRGTSYTIVQAANVDGNFKSVDFTQAGLSGTNVWKISRTATTVTATVTDPYLLIEIVDGDAMLSWPGPSHLQFSPDLLTPFIDVIDAVSPYVTPLNDAKKFYRLRY